jgi:hypothetical protein
MWWSKDDLQSNLAKGSLGKVGPPDIGDTHVEAREGGRLQVLQWLITSSYPARGDFKT